MTRDVLLVRSHDDAGRVAGPVEVGDRERVDDLALIFVFVLAGGDVRVEPDHVALRVHRADLGRVLHQHREAGDGSAVAVPCIHVAVLARGDDVEAVAGGGVEFCEHRRGHEAALGALTGAEALGLPRRVAGQRRARVVGVGFLVEDEFPGGVPCVHVALHVVGHDLFAPVAEQIPGDPPRYMHRRTPQLADLLDQFMERRATVSSLAAGPGQASRHG